MKKHIPHYLFRTVKGLLAVAASFSAMSALAQIGPASTTLTSNFYAPSVSADNSVVAYWVNSSPSQIQIYSGGTGVTITTGLGGNCSRPCLSRDGTAVVFYASPAAGYSVEPYIAEAPYWTPYEITSATSTVAGADYTSAPPSVSDNQGTALAPLHYVAYNSLQSIGGKHPVYPEIEVWNESTGVTTTASLNSSGVQANSTCSYPVINANGTAVAYLSSASNLVSTGSTAGSVQLFYATLSTTWSTTYCPSYGLTSATWPSISSNGNVLVFQGTNSTGIDVYKYSPGSSASIPYSAAYITGYTGPGGPAGQTLCPGISPDGDYMIVESNRNFTGSNPVDSYYTPALGQVDIFCTFVINLSSGSAYLESFDYRSYGSPSSEVLLEGYWGSMSNADISGNYHGAFFAGPETYITSSQTSAYDIFIF